MSVIFSNLLLSVIATNSALPSQDIEHIKVTGQEIKHSANYLILNRDEFIDSAQNLSSVLRKINGIQVRKISGIGNPASISIRGSSSKQVQLYIDGQLVNDGQFGGFDINQLPVEHIQSIEVSKAQAIGTGATPIGGVIRINTYNPNSDTLRFSGGLGSFGYRELNVTSNTLFDKSSMAINASHLRSDNDYDFLVPQPFANPSQATTEALRHNEFEKTSLSLGNQWLLGNQQLRFNGQYVKQDKALPLYQSNAPINDSSFDTRQWRFGANYLWQPQQTWFHQFEVEGYFDNKDEQYINDIDNTRLLDGRYDMRKTNLTIKPTFVIAKVNVTPFVEFNHQRFISRTHVPGEQVFCNGISVCDVKATTNQWLLGTRLDWQSDESPLSSHVLVTNLRDDSDSLTLNKINNTKEQQRDNFTSGELGALYRWRNIDFSGSLSRGVRMPTMFERYGDRGLFKGNGNLKPEQSTAMSLAADYQQASWSVSSSLYVKRVSDAIIATFNSSGIGSYDNVSDADISGWELQGDYQLSEQLSISGQINLIDSNNNSPFVAFNNKKLPGIYHQELSGNLSYHINETWSLDVASEYSKGLHFNLPNKSAKGASNRWLTNISARWQRSQYVFYVGIDNLFDEGYQDLANRPAQGRSFFIKFSFEE